MKEETIQVREHLCASGLALPGSSPPIYSPSVPTPQLAWPLAQWTNCLIWTQQALHKWVSTRPSLTPKQTLAHGGENLPTLHFYFWIVKRWNQDSLTLWQNHLISGTFSFVPGGRYNFQVDSAENSNSFFTLTWPHAPYEDDRWEPPLQNRGSMGECQNLNADMWTSRLAPRIPRQQSHGLWLHASLQGDLILLTKRLQTANWPTIALIQQAECRGPSSIIKKEGSRLSMGLV